MAVFSFWNGLREGAVLGLCWGIIANAGKVLRAIRLYRKERLPGTRYVGFPRL